jgi:poly(A) polymerase
MLDIKQKPHLHATWIDPYATEIVERLQKAGFKTYLVGGCVRDLLAGIHPKDYDIATNAPPNDIRKKVWGSYVIGRRFRLVLAKRGDQQFEIATFRRGSKPEDFVEGEDQPFGDNFFGTEEEDAIRRDFTINALFYDPVKNEIIDYAKGRADIDARILRMIGDPKERIIEDPIRSLRAVRLSHKLKFMIEPSLRAAIQETSAEVVKTALPRRREEYLKFLRLDDHVPALCELYDLHLMEHLLPSLKEIWDQPEKRDLFVDYMHRAEEITWDYRNPSEIYLPLILAFDRTFEGDPDLEAKREQFMKNELGMFKSESVEVMQTIELAHSLPDAVSFKKRGQRRQSAFLNHPILPYALRIARMEVLASPADLSFWESSLRQRTQSGAEPLPRRK